MPDKNKKFHEFALKSSLFKGQYDYYYCFLKSEKIAHVLCLLKERNALSDTTSAEVLLQSAIELPQSVVHFVAGEVAMEAILAHIFSLLSGIRLAVTQKILSKENAHIIGQEYEHLAEKISTNRQLSPFISADDFLLPTLPAEGPIPLVSISGSTDITTLTRPVKDIYKGHTNQQHSSHGEERMSLILELVRKNKSQSIKDISAVVKDCSEKTIQRDLSLLVQKGLIQKQGERRWSIYLAV